MLSEEKRFFIRVLSDHINERETEPIEQINWKEISRLAKIHQVEGIIYYQCKKNMPMDVKARFEKAFMATVFHYANLKNTKNEVEGAFRENKIAFFVVKGFEIAKYYPIDSLRTMGDCDVVLQHEDMKKAIGVMKQLGFSSSMRYNVEQWPCDKNGVHFELHEALVQDGEFTNKIQEVFFNEYKPYLLEESLDISFHFLFLLMHIRKHFLNYNVGIRHFMDLAVVIKNVPDLKWLWIKEKLVRLKLLRFAQVCMVLVDNWFGIKSSIECGELRSQQYEQLTEGMLNGGVFGYSDGNNLRNAEKTYLAKAKGPLWLRRKQILLRNMFPKYSLMKSYPGCGFLYDKPFLLPAAWAYRLIFLTARMGKGNKRTIQDHRESIFQEDILEREKVLKMIGLL